MLGGMVCKAYTHRFHRSSYLLKMRKIRYSALTTLFVTTPFSVMMRRK